MYFVSKGTASFVLRSVTIVVNPSSLISSSVDSNDSADGGCCAAWTSVLFITAANDNPITTEPTYFPIFLREYCFFMSFLFILYLLLFEFVYSI